ncbi:hypothetical protein [Svornostia abyssi]|uniref:hypothetical protein n=1 Tax=Svornostia abyssi TaxID=2898438 RepID=UPI00338EB319
MTPSTTTTPYRNAAATSGSVRDSAERNDPPMLGRRPATISTTATTWTAVMSGGMTTEKSSWLTPSAAASVFSGSNSAPAQTPSTSTTVGAMRTNASVRNTAR